MAFDYTDCSIVSSIPDNRTGTISSPAQEGDFRFLAVSKLSWVSS